MGDKNPIRTLRDYSKPSHEGYVNTIELPVGNNVDLALYDNESLNDPRDFAKLVKAIALPQDVQSTSDHFTTSCKICSGPHDTQYCMEDPEQAFVEYASSRTDEVGEGLVSNFMASQDVRLSKFGANFKRQQGEMTNKIDTMLKAITDQTTGTLPSNMVKNPKLSTSPVLSGRSNPTQDPQCSNHVHGSINAIIIHPKQPEESQVNRPDEGQEEEGNLRNTSSYPHPQPDLLASIATEQVRKLNSMLESLGLVPRSSNMKFVCSKKDDREVMFIEIIRDDDEPQNKGPNDGKGATTEGPVVEYFDTFPTRDELTYHKKLNPRENANGGVSNFTGRIKGMHVFVGNFTYIVDFMIIEDISSIIDPRLSQVVLGKPFVETSNMTHDPQEGVVRFTNGNDEVAYKMPHKIEQYNSLSNLEKEHTKSVYLRNEEDKRRGVEYVMNKILGFYKECLELRPEYLTGIEDEGEVT
ncbi:hypothetical protein Tco_0908842 [Tanacetum coccineum]|uniref:MAK10-like protein n=1 Tax=Tanacetum coccineum TaxID=301880 RepID=A0ABQ5CQE0_9ASTR